MTGENKTPREAFLKYMNTSSSPFMGESRPDPTAVSDLRSIAGAWIAEGQYFGAGYALYRAIDFAWVIWTLSLLAFSRH